MGQSITKNNFSARDFDAFSLRLHHNLEALRHTLDMPGFGKVPTTLGAELEFYIVDHAGNPLAINREIQAQANDPNVTLELNRYNLEYNFPVYDFKHGPFLNLEADLQSALMRLDSLAGKQNGNVLAIGILPTLTEDFLGPAYMTQDVRYQVLSEILIAMRGGSFDLDIEGVDHLQVTRQDITAEGVCTSFQVHYCSDIENFVDTWNAMTLVTPLVLAISANSPILFGKRLWQESRVPLFKQATDSRREGMRWHDLARVDLTRDWLRHSAYELFAQRVYLYPPLIPLCDSEDPMQAIAKGQLPGLHELNLHNGTVWHWNRPIYSNQGEGHIRIELRSLPAGPSAVDMAANAAFHIGLAIGLVTQIDELIPAMPFHFVAQNFMEAAKDGMAARLIWPSLTQNRLSDQPVRELGLSLIETARQGLISLGIGEVEITRMLAVIEARLDSGQSGAVWQLENYQRLLREMPAEEALSTLVSEYAKHSFKNAAVAGWPLING